MTRSLLAIIFGVLLVLSLVVGLGFAFLRFDPREELVRMREALLEATALKESAAFSWTTDEQGVRETTTVYTDGRLDLGNPARIEHATRFRVARVRKDEDFIDLKGEIHRRGDRVFLTYAPPGPEIPGVDFSRPDTWVEFQHEDFSKWGPVLPGLDAPLAFPAVSRGVWTPEDMMRLRELVGAADVMHVWHDDEQERVRGQEARILRGRLDPDAMRSFLFDVVRAKEGRDPTEEERLAIGEDVWLYRHLRLKLWVGKDDHLPYRIQAAGFVPGEGGDANMIIDARIELSEHNEPIELPTLPRNALSFLEILRTVAPDLGEGGSGFGFLGEEQFVTEREVVLPREERAGATDVDGDGLSATAEVFYGTNPFDPDTDGDGVNDGQEILDGTNPRGDGTLFGF